MTFDPAWNDLHAKRAWGVYPNEHLMRFAKRTFLDPEGCRAIDLGCGVGAQTIFLAGMGFAVIGIDGSESAITRLRASRTWNKWYEMTADITDVDLDPSVYDLVVDVCTLQHLPFDDAKTIIARAHSWLKPGGWFFSLMASHEFDMECEIPPRMIGYVDFVSLFPAAQWKLALGHELIERPHEGIDRLQGGTVAHWIIEAQKAN